jgi:hypothetical protein
MPDNILTLIPHPLVTEYEGGIAIRHNERSRFANLRWQAGKIVHEHRCYRDNGMTSPFNERVTLFYLLGYGDNRDEAVAMAKKKMGNGGQ